MSEERKVILFVFFCYVFCFLCQENVAINQMGGSMVPRVLKW